MQKSIFIEGANSTVFIEGLLLKNTVSKNIIELVACIKKLETNSLHIVVAFSKKAWNLVQPKWSPKELEPFKTVNGVANYSMPATQTDIFIWAHSNSIGELFDLKKEIQEKAIGIFDITVMQDGFQYHDSRDLMGFVDGSANPKEDERMKAALIPKGEVGEQGSYVFAQKWKHDLSAFNDIPEHVQEKIIGRTKKESIELEGEDMPKNSHVSRTDVKLDGEAMKIYRRSYPYGDIINNGLYFLAFACSIKRIDIQLRSMVGDTEDKIHDRLMEFSAPLTGSYFFAPSDTDLRTIIG
ncbi:MAG: Dyp-type peroxidase [Cyclobacteriaceae bacterium]|nr:Dyp-type peroxidase [Cyclobacteriaceae bacterium]